MKGQANLISRQEFKEVKLALDKYQKAKYPELINSLPSHGKIAKIQSKDLDFQGQKTDGKLSQKQIVSETIQGIYIKSKSVYNFLTQLKYEG